MATVTNPSPYPLFCVPLGRVLDPDEMVEVTEAVAELVSQAVFEVESSEKPRRKSTKSEVKDKDDAEK